MVQVAEGAIGADSPGTTATAGPHEPQIVIGSRPPSAAATPSDLSSADHLPVVQDWRDQLMSAYAADPWFRDESNLEQLTLDEGLWYNVDGRVVIPATPALRRKLIADFHDSPYVWPCGY